MKNLRWRLACFFWWLVEPGCQMTLSECWEYAGCMRREDFEGHSARAAVEIEHSYWEY